VTRTRPGADRTADRLRALGHEPVVAPVLEVRTLPWSAELERVGALAFTSANGVRAFAAVSGTRDLPVFAVGDATAAAAGAAGFRAVRSAAGNVEALARTLAAAGPFGGPVLHVAGARRAGDLAGALAATGLETHTITAYETVATGAAAPTGIDAVLVHSPEAARRLAALWAGDILFACMSEAAAAPLRDGGDRRVAVAAGPNETALLALLG
jgi:uroporphyrinogen-III synthase